MENSENNLDNQPNLLIPQDLEEQDKPGSPKRPRHFTVAKLSKADHDLLRDLAKKGKVTDRYTAFLEIVEYVQALTAEDVKVPRLDPIRLGYPLTLKAALDAKHLELGKPTIRLLIAASRKWLADKKKT